MLKVKPVPPPEVVIVKEPLGVERHGVAAFDVPLTVNVTEVQGSLAAIVNELAPVHPRLSLAVIE